MFLIQTKSPLPSLSFMFQFPTLFFFHLSANSPFSFFFPCFFLYLSHRVWVCFSNKYPSTRVPCLKS
jgi:hypothetical protein